MVFANPGSAGAPLKPLFLAGYILGFLGLGIWFSAFMGPAGDSPGRGHAMLAMQGFLFALSSGILLAEVPSRLGIDPMPRLSSALIPVFLLGMGICAMIQLPVPGQVAFLAACLLVFGYVARGLFLAARSPGPDFLFIACAPLMAIWGAGLRIAAASGYITDSSWDRLGALALYQGYFLLFALGAMPDLARTGRRVNPGHPRSRWNLNAAILVLLGLALALEAFSPRFGNPSLAIRCAYLIKSALVGWLLFLRTGPEPLPLTGAAHPRGVIIGLILVLSGMGLAALFPAQAVGVSHLAYVGGFAWLVLDQSARVLDERGSLSAYLKGWGNIILFASMLLLGAIMRIIAEFAASSRGLFLILAAAFALLPFLAWTWRILPFLGTRSENPERASQGTRKRG